MPTGSLEKETGPKPRERKGSKRQGNGYEFEQSLDRHGKKQQRLEYRDQFLYEQSHYQLKPNLKAQTQNRNL